MSVSNSQKGIIYAIRKNPGLINLVGKNTKVTSVLGSTDFDILLEFVVNRRGNDKDNSKVEKISKETRDIKDLWDDVFKDSIGEWIRNIGCSTPRNSKWRRDKQFLERYTPSPTPERYYEASDDGDVWF